MNIEFDDQNIDVKDIMRQIKENLGKRNYSNDRLAQLGDSIKSDASFDLSRLEAMQFKLNRMWNITADKTIFSHRKVAGKAIVFIKKCIRKALRWYVNPIVQEQSEFNAVVVQSINEVVEQLKKMDAHFTNAIKNQQITKVEAPSVDAIEKRLQEVEAAFESKLHHQVSSLKEHFSGNLSAISHTVENQKRIIDSDTRTIRIANERLRRIERNRRDSEPASSEIIVSNEVNNKKSSEYEFDYYLFEEMYRGSREEIKNRQKQYLNYFKNGDHVLDLGCGRGEFTELLLEQGLSVTAVDLNDDMIAYCSERGFPIIKSDILNYLRSLEDNSVNGIFLGQVIEHMSPSDLLELVNLSHDKLKPSGWFIAETPNPQCLSVFAQSFYMDITHEKPVHPLTAKFMLESTGFNDVEVNYLSLNDDNLRLPRLTLDGEGINSENLKQFNDTIEHWNNVIFGYQDYYIAGRK